MTMWTLKQIGEKLGVRERTVRSWVRTKKLRAIHPDKGWVWRVKDDELQRFLSNESWTAESIVPYLQHQLPGLYKKA